MSNYFAPVSALKTVNWADANAAKAAVKQVLEFAKGKASTTIVVNAKDRAAFRRNALQLFHTGFDLNDKLNRALHADLRAATSILMRMCV
jgi:hypothetical protein